MNILILEGVLGVGKTMGAVILANYLKARSPHTTLYSNFGMAGSKPFTSLYDFLDCTDNFCSVIVLDEAHIDLDARDFSTNHVKFMSKTSFYLRKMRTTLIITTPLFENLDTRIRGIANSLVRVRKDKEYFYYDYFDVQSCIYKKTKRIRQSVAFGLDLYDTHAIVTPVEVPENKQAFNDFLVQLKERTLNYYSDEEKRLHA